MTALLPPKPARARGRRSLLDLLRLSTRSSLEVFYDSSFNVDVGSVRLPTLPRLRRRQLVTVREPTLARHVLTKGAASYRKSAIMESMLRELTGESVFVADGEAWRRQRRLLDPAFAQASLRRVFPAMHAACQAVVERLESHVEASPATPVAADREMTRFAADVIFRTLFSEPITALEASLIFDAFETFQAVAYAQGMLSVVGVPRALTPGAGKSRRAARRIRELLGARLQRRLDDLAADRPVPQDDLLAVMLQAGPDGDRFSEEELLDQVAILFLAGHETTASALSWSLYLIATHPEIQARLRQEARLVRPGRAAAHADIKRLPLARDVFRETLRLYPPVAFFARDATRPECLGGREIEAGAVVVVAPWLLHRRPATWGNADAFDPGRFSSRSGAEAARCAYMPFGAGERSCIGAAFAMQEATLLLTTLTERFEITPAPGPQPEPIGRLTLRSRNGVRLRFTRAA